MPPNNHPRKSIIKMPPPATTTQSSGKETRRQDSTLESYEAIFRMFDKNRDRTLNLGELGAAMRATGMNPKKRDLQAILDSYDNNRDKRLDFDEFVAFCQRIPPDSEESLINSFSVFDRDGNGKIDTKEFRYAMRNFGEKLSDEELDAMLTLADTNRDNHIDYKEFAAMLAPPAAAGSKARSKPNATFQ